MKKFLIALTLVATMSLGACTTNSDGSAWGNKQTMGTASGALIGGILGSRVGGHEGKLWATGAGVLLGALAGSEIGKSLDRADMQYHSQAYSNAYSAPMNETISWNNPQSGHRGTVTPIQEGRSSAGYTCRKFKEAIFIDGEAQTAVGTACQQPDGTWRIQN